MRSAVRLLLGLALVVPGSAPAPAAVPNPANSSIVASGSPLPCQFRFRADGGLDELVLNITVRGAFMEPISNCSTYVSLNPTGGSVICSGDGLVRGAWTDASGAVEVSWNRLGGRGTCEVDVTTTCLAPIGLGKVSVDFTSPDLDGSCDGADVFDLGLWAQGLPPGYVRESDYNCDGLVDVFDLAVWAGGIGR
ncbi:MAG TPA: hypothetical protein VKU85_16925 [bacterium]|nr:hypothetical protein [bacterium]